SIATDPRPNKKNHLTFLRETKSATRTGDRSLMLHASRVLALDIASFLQCLIELTPNPRTMAVWQGGAVPRSKPAPLMPALGHFRQIGPPPPLAACPLRSKSGQTSRITSHVSEVPKRKSPALSKRQKFAVD